MRTNRKFQPSIDGMEYRIASSTVVPSAVVSDPTDPVIPPTVNVFYSPDSGDDPPVTQPDIPPTGPGGPGTSS